MTALAGQGPMLQIRNLGVRFPTPHGELTALEHLSLDIPRGKTLAIVGESGSGKSVLARAVLRLLPRKATLDPASQILFDGTDLLRLDGQAMQGVRGKRIAMVFQDPMTALNPTLSVGAQLAEGMRLHLGSSRGAAVARAAELLAQVGINSPERRLLQYPHELSGGMRQRVVIAMAIACQPQLLFADEPTTALDVTVQAEILDLLRRLQREHQMAMVLVTHDLGVAANYADEIAVMYAGHLVERAATRTLLRSPRMPYTRALLQSIPSLNDAPHAVLPTIAGRPPTVYGAQAGCRFTARCTRALERCANETPAFSAAAVAGQGFRCWNPLEAA